MNFFALNVRLLALAVSRSVMTVASWVASLLPWQRTSSAIPVVFETLLSTLSTLSWKTSAATFKPKGKRSHLYFPHGVLKVVRKLLSLSKGTCQYPDFASSKLKYFEPVSSGKISSIVLLYQRFRFIALLRSLGSRHNLREPSGFFTGTIQLIHSVCSFTS